MASRSTTTPRATPRGRAASGLYVHGTGRNGRVWEDHMAAIAETHTPVAIDLPGHGRSSGRGFRGMADYAHVVMELGRALGWERFVVAGHSLGGGVAITAALYHPEEHIAGCRLAIIDGGGHWAFREQSETFNAIVT